MHDSKRQRLSHKSASGNQTPCGSRFAKQKEIAKYTAKPGLTSIVAQKTKNNKNGVQKTGFGQVGGVEEFEKRWVNRGWAVEGRGEAVGGRGAPPPQKPSKKKKQRVGRGEAVERPWAAVGGRGAPPQTFCFFLSPTRFSVKFGIFWNPTRFSVNFAFCSSRFRKIRCRCYALVCAAGFGYSRPFFGANPVVGVFHGDGVGEGCARQLQPFFSNCFGSNPKQ